MPSPFLSNEEIVLRARKNLPQGAWDYLVGASESETTMRRNRLAFDSLAFRPRVLRDVSTINTSTTFLGLDLAIPALLAPIGSLQVFNPDGGAASTRAAADFGIMHVVSSVTEPTLEEIAAAADRPKVFQLYIHGDWAWVEDMIARVKSAGYIGLCITVDTDHYSRRERPMLTRWTPPTRRNPVSYDVSHAAAVTWDTVDKIKNLAGLPFMLKGIATAEDARIAIDHGVDVIWVSNHGGRQLDHGQGTMEMLPEIAEAVSGRAEIVLDGGVQRGADIAKAVALGARAVALGKLQGWGLAADGQAGILRMLQILEEELTIAMGLLGVTSIDQLNPDYISKAQATTTPHEMSSWTNLPGNRIL